MGTYVSEDRKLGLGFRRLAIIDLSTAGHQPMCNEDGSIWIVFNGEIYNHADYREQLQALGHPYKGRSDTETILHLYEEFGLDCVQKLRGMFAIALWDQRRSRLWLVRDRLGIKPLYYTFQDGVLIFASEIKAILEYPGVSRDVDDEALSDYLTFMVAAAPKTLFKNIYKLPAGHFLTVDAGGDRKITRYWDVSTAGENGCKSPEDYSARLSELLEESVRLRMMSDVPFGAFLSGGLDSSANVALMARHTDQPVNTFSVGFKKYEEYNELQYARQISREFGTNHREVLIDDRDALDYLPQLVDSQDEPIADWVCVPLYFVSKLVRDSGVIVAHVGEGSDELFTGYTSYLKWLKLNRSWPILRLAPQFIWQGGINVAANLARSGVQGAERLGRWFNYISNEDGSFWGNAIVFRGQQKDLLLKGRYWNGNRPANSKRIIESFYNELAQSGSDYDALREIIYVELKQRLSELLLMRVDKISMSTSIEARVPFLDHKLVEFAMSIPTSIRIEGNRQKALLKRAVRGLIPDNIIDRPKQGFGAPVATWFRNELKSQVRSVLLESRIHQRGYFDLDFIRFLLDAHQSGAQDKSTQLWTLYNLAQWYEHWID